MKHKTVTKTSNSDLLKFILVQSECECDEYNTVFGLEQLMTGQFTVRYHKYDMNK